MDEEEFDREESFYFKSRREENVNEQDNYNEFEFDEEMNEPSSPDSETNKNQRDNEYNYGFDDGGQGYYSIFPKRRMETEYNLQSFNYPKLKPQLDSEEEMEKFSDRRRTVRYSDDEPEPYRPEINYGYGYGDGGFGSYGSPPEDERNINRFSNNRYRDYSENEGCKFRNNNTGDDMPTIRTRPLYSPYGETRFGNSRYSGFSGYSGLSGYSESSLSGPSTPEPIYGKLSREEGGRVGLRNMGNTCYLNSTLQCLTATVELSFKLAEELESGELMKERKDKRFLQATARLFREMWQSEGKISSIGRSVLPSQFKSILGQVDSRFSGYRQEDSQEALAIILDRLHEELKIPCEAVTTEEEDEVSTADGWEKYCKKENSIVRELFHGQLKSSLKCCECSFKSETFEPFCFLNLPIPSTVVSEDEDDILDDSMAVSNGYSKGSVDSQIVTSVNVEKFNILCFNDKIFNAESSYLIMNRTFKNLNEFRLFHRGAGVWIVELEGNRVISVKTKLPSVQELLNAKHAFIAFRAEIMFKNYLITFVAAKSGETVGFPVLIRTELKETLTPALFIKKFLKSTIRSILVRRFPERLKSFDSALSLMLESANEYFKVEFVKNDPIDLIHVRVIILNDKSDFNEMIFFKEIDDPNDLFEELCIDLVEEEDDSVKYVSDDDDIFNMPDNNIPKLMTDNNVAVSLRDCFDRLFSIEHLSEADEWKCEKCGIPVRAEKRLELWRLPEILILHLKRFSFGTPTTSMMMSYSIYGSGVGVGGGSKITKPVDFQIELDMKEVLGENCPETKSQYELFGISQHFGSLNYGHYTAIAKHEPTGKWYLADDGSITLYDSLNDWYTDKVKESAYVLFYRRI